MDDSPNTIPPVDLKAGRADPVTTLDQLLVKLREATLYCGALSDVNHLFGQAADALEAAARENERLREALAKIELIATNHAGWIEQKLEQRWAVVCDIHSIARKATAPTSEESSHE